MDLEREEKTIVLFVLPRDLCLVAHKLNLVTSHTVALARTINQICSQPEMPLVTVREWNPRIEGDKDGVIRIHLPDSTEDERGAILAAAQNTRELLSKLTDVKADEIGVEIESGAEASEAPPGPCDISMAIFAQGI
jgi:hypothetical protein